VIGLWKQLRMGGFYRTKDARFVLMLICQGGKKCAKESIYTLGGKKRDLITSVKKHSVWCRWFVLAPCKGMNNKLWREVLVSLLMHANKNGREALFTLHANKTGREALPKRDACSQPDCTLL
jgi:hypothetical protein